MHDYRATTSHSRTGTFLLFAAGESPSSPPAVAVNPEAAFRFELILEAVRSRTGCATQRLGIQMVKRWRPACALAIESTSFTLLIELALTWFGVWSKEPNQRERNRPLSQKLHVEARNHRYTQLTVEYTQKPRELCDSCRFLSE